MAKKSVNDLFGASFNQDAITFTISKADLAGTSLTAQLVNTGQQLIVALLKYWLLSLTASNRSANPDETITISYDGQSTRTEGSNVYRVDTYRVQTFLLTPPTEPDPDNY